MMGAIYSRAAKFWYGSGRSLVGVTARWTLCELLALRSKYWDDYSIAPAEDTRDPTIADLELPLDFNADDINAISHTFGRDWFERLWIRQEIILADQQVAIVVCGSCSIPWELFRIAWLLVRRKPLGSLGKDLDGRLTSLNGFLYQYPETSLNTLRQDFAHRSCMDPWDRIYAVRELLGRKLQTFIQPDYRKQVANVYRDAVIKYIEQVGGLHRLISGVRIQIFEMVWNTMLSRDKYSGRFEILALSFKLEWMRSKLFPVGVAWKQMHCMRHKPCVCRRGEKIAYWIMPLAHKRYNLR